MTPSEITMVFEAYEHKLKMQQYTAWLHGMYVRCAVASCFSKDADYPENPMDSKNVVDVENMSEEEKQQYIENLFVSLQAMGSNFELEKNGGVV